MNLLIDIINNCMYTWFDNKIDQFFITIFIQIQLWLSNYRKSVKNLIFYYSETFFSLIIYLLCGDLRRSQSCWNTVLSFLSIFWGILMFLFLFFFVWFNWIIWGLSCSCFNKWMWTKYNRYEKYKKGWMAIKYQIIKLLVF